MVEGVTDGFERRLEIQGVGYRAKLKGKTLEMALGYSHPVTIEAPDGIEFEVPQPTEVVVRGIDKQLVGEIAARIRKTPPAGAVQGQGRPLRGRARRPQGREEGLMAVLTKPQQRLRRRRRVRAQDPRERRAAAALRLPLEPGRLRPADRRRRRPHGGLGDLDRGRSSGSSTRWSRRSGPGSCSPSAPRRAGDRDLRLRPRRLPVPRPRRGARRGRPRRGDWLLMTDAIRPLP